MSDEAKMSIDEYAIAQREKQLRRAPRSPYPRWTTIANGRVYRPVMRLLHWVGWCYPTPTFVEPGNVWCHWCGMRGKR